MILVRLNELYQEFKKQHPDRKIGFTKFCELRPKWCVNVTSSGMHSVCVCAYHQNVKLISAATPLKIYYKELMALCVCEINSRNCMFRLCENCPSKSEIKEKLFNFFLENDYEENDTVSYKQWLSTDRAALTTIQTTVTEFIETAVDMISSLCTHHFIKEA